MLQFKKYEPKEANLTDLGTVASQIPGGKLSFTPNSLAKYQAGQIKAISILLTNKKGDSTTAPLSKRVSATISNALKAGKTKADCLAAILKLMIVETEDGSNIISAPRGEGGTEEEVSVASAKANATAYEDLAY